MAEATSDQALEIEQDPEQGIEQEINQHTHSEFDRAKDFARMQRIGTWHAAAVLAALTLFGAGNIWAAQSGLVLAHVVAIANTLVVGRVVGSILHEWGHFAGARLSGAHSPVLSKPVKLFFMFNFDMENNSVEQFVWMSMGGIITNWVIAIAALLMLPLDTLSGAALAAVFIGIAVNVSYFEVPVVLRTRETGNPKNELQTQLDTQGLSQTPGIIVGALVWLALV